METPKTAEVGKGVYLIDTEMHGVSGLNAVYLVKGRQLALIDSGPASSAEKVLRGIRHLGFDLKSVAYIVISHIHLDHGGATGHLLKELPQARAVVWHKAIKHVIDPSRLVAATREAQGERGLRAYGEPLPVAEGRVIPADDGHTLDLGDGVSLNILYSPGHSRHEVTVYEKKEGALFTGDGAGFFLGKETLIPTAIAPDFDPDIYLGTISKVMALPLKTLFFPHFGPASRVKETLQLNFQELDVWANLLKKDIEKKDWETARAKLRNHLVKKVEAVKANHPLYEYMVEDQIPMFLEGYVGYWKNKAEAPVSS